MLCHWSSRLRTIISMPGICLRAWLLPGLVDGETGLLLDPCGVFGNNIAGKARKDRKGFDGIVHKPTPKECVVCGMRKTRLAMAIS